MLRSRTKNSIAAAVVASAACLCPGHEPRQGSPVNRSRGDLRLVFFHVSPVRGAFHLDGVTSADNPSLAAICCTVVDPDAGRWQVGRRLVAAACEKESGPGMVSSGRDSSRVGMFGFERARADRGYCPEGSFSFSGGGVCLMNPRSIASFRSCSRRSIPFVSFIVAKVAMPKSPTSAM